MVACSGVAARKGQAAIARPLVLGWRPTRVRLPCWAYCIGLVFGILIVEGLGIHFAVLGVITHGFDGGPGECDDAVAGTSPTSTGREQCPEGAHGEL